MRWGLIDRIDEMVEGEHARGARTYPADLPLFIDHFPSYPVVPGVLVLESLAQLSGKLIGYTVRRQRGDWPFPILSMMDRVKFRKFIRPDQEITLETRFVALREESAVMAVKARIGRKVHSQAEQFFVFNAVPMVGEERERVEGHEHRELRRLWSGCPEPPRATPPRADPPQESSSEEEGA